MLQLRIYTSFQAIIWFTFIPNTQSSVEGTFCPIPELASSPTKASEDFCIGWNKELVEHVCEHCTCSTICNDNTSPWHQKSSLSLQFNSFAPLVRNKAAGPEAPEDWRSLRHPGPASTCYRWAASAFPSRRSFRFVPLTAPFFRSFIEPVRLGRPSRSSVWV